MGFTDFLSYYKQIKSTAGFDFVNNWWDKINAFHKFGGPDWTKSYFYSI
jgi:hypothetical protein